MNKTIKYIFGSLIILSTIFLIYIGMPPEFFDIFGLVVFSFFLYVGVKLIKDKKISYLEKDLILLIAILGLIVDGYIVLTTFIL